MKLIPLALIPLMMASLALAGLYYTGLGFGYTTGIYMGNVSTVTFSNGTLVPTDYSFVYAANVSSSVPAQLIGLYANFSASGRVYGVICSVKNEFGSYSSDGVLYRTSAGYMVACDFRAAHNEGESPFSDPSLPRFKRARKFTVSFEFFVHSNVTIDVTGATAFLYHSRTPTNFVILKTPSGYDLKVEPIRFSYLALGTRARDGLVVELLGSKNPSDFLNLTFKACNWSGHGGVLLQFFSSDPRFHNGGRYLLVEPSNCKNTYFPDFKRRWVVLGGLHVKELSDINGVSITGTVYEAPTDNWELRYWGIRIGVFFLFGIGLGIFIGWRRWGRV
ncbi:hypothetical protein [Thermococcus sp.]